MAMFSVLYVIIFPSSALDISPPNDVEGFPPVFTLRYPSAAVAGLAPTQGERWRCVACLASAFRALFWFIFYFYLFWSASIILEKLKSYQLYL
jgi:hypothetical protein